MPFEFSFANSPIADRPFHRVGVNLAVLEQPGQIERLEFLGAERSELSRRRRSMCTEPSCNASISSLSLYNLEFG